MSMIKKSQVENALGKMELHLFGKSQESNKYTNIPSRLTYAFCEAYSRNYYPEESTVLIESYRLLQSKGYYYNEE